MQDKKLPVFCRDQSIPAVRASQLHGREAVILLGELGITDFTGELSFAVWSFWYGRIWKMER